ncbi:MAG: Glu-tRNA(Gln) amidotransferase subunit GatE [Nanopusillaceae archaeon]
MKAGLEIHQQLNTKEKLFCSCPTELFDNYTHRIERKLRVTQSEIGKKDVAAEYETMKDKLYIYEYSNEYSCLVELDEEPPHLINLEALKFGLLISTYFNMYVPKVLQVMRKIVVDGSNTSGFQRTLLLALDGKIKYKNKEITIQTICIEEDAARKIEEGEKYIIYRLDRLGIPLIEISTGPDMTNPQEVKEIAEYIGLILRLTGKVKRGLGTIRQDLNISIEGGEKVEIKGVQNLKIMDKIVENEIKRQEKILEWGKIVRERGIDGYELEE